MESTVWGWLGFILFVLALLAFDLGVAKMLLRGTQRARNSGSLPQFSVLSSTRKFAKIGGFLPFPVR